MPMQISQNEVSHTRFGNLEGQQANAVAEYRLLPITKRTDRRLTPLLPSSSRRPTASRAMGPYYKTDRPRAFFNMPFRHEFRKHVDEIDYAEIKALYTKLTDIDEHLDSSEFRLQICWRDERW